MHWMSIIGLCFIVLGTIFTFFGTYFNDKKSQTEVTHKIEEKNKVIENINSNNIELIKQYAELKRGNDQLLIQNDELKDKIDDYQKAN